MRLILDGITLPNPLPGGFTIKAFKISDSKRLANGDMNAEFIALKRQFNFTYTVLGEQDYIKIRDLINSPKMFYTLQYDDDGTGLKTVTVYTGAIGQSSYRIGTGHDGWYWKNVSFALIER